MLFKKKTPLQEYCTKSVDAVFTKEQEATWDAFRRDCGDNQLSATNMKRERQYLFSDGYLSDFLRNRQGQMLAEADGVTSDYLLKVSVDDLADHLADKYRVEQVVLGDTPEIAEHGETEVDVSQDQMRYIRDRSQPFLSRQHSRFLSYSFRGNLSYFIFAQPGII